MGWTFRMVFEGVCAFVPDTPLYRKQDEDRFVAATPPPKQMTVLLPDLQQAAPASWSTPALPAVRAAHFPLLLFKLDDWRPESDRFIDLKLRVPAEGCDKGILVLQGDAIDLPSSGSELAVTTLESEQPFPGDKDKRSLWWLPRLAEISPQASKFPKRLRPKAGRALDRRLAAAVTLKSGNLFTHSFNLTTPGSSEPTLWSFTPADGTGPSVWNRAVANRIAFELSDLTEPVRLQFSRHVQGHELISAALFSPPPGSRQNEVEITVANVELEKLFEDQGLFRPAPIGARDPDFEAFYDLLGVTAKNNLPVPTRPSGMDAFGPDTKPCAPALGG